MIVKQSFVSPELYKKDRSFYIIWLSPSSPKQDSAFQTKIIRVTVCLSSCKAIYYIAMPRLAMPMSAKTVPSVVSQS